MRHWLLIVASVFLFGAPAFGADYTVNDPAADPPNEFPDFAEIQDAIDICVDGDSITVYGPGPYLPIDTLGLNIEILGELGPLGGPPTIEGDGSAPGIACYQGETEELIIQGPFTITGCAGGVYLDGTTPTLSFLTIDGNDGPGITVVNAAPPTMVLCTISNNTADYGGGVLTQSMGQPTAVDLWGCTLDTNMATAGPPDAGDPYAGGGGVWAFDATVQMTLCTITGCTSGADGGGLSLRAASAVLTDTGIAACVAETHGGGAALWRWENPLFAGSSLEMLGQSIAACSTTSGDGGGVYVSESSFDGTSMAIGVPPSAINVAGRHGGGIACYDGTATLAGSLGGNVAGVDGGGFFGHEASMTLYGAASSNVAGDDGGGLYGQSNTNMVIYGTPGQPTIDRNTASHRGGGIFSAGETAAATIVTATVCGNVGDEFDEPELDDQIFGNYTDLGGSCIAISCEDTDFNGVPDECEGFEDATVLDVPGEYATIQAAIADATTGDTVRVGPGVWTGSGDAVIDFQGKLITVESVEGAETTILDGSGLRRVVNFSDGETAEAVLVGFTIRNGIAADGGGVRCAAADPTIMNCVITENVAMNPGGEGGRGGGVYLDHASPTFTDCDITQNHATGFGTRAMGGGLYSRGGDPVLTRGIVTGNQAAGGPGGPVGGGLCFIEAEDPQVTNVTISGNEAETAGGASYGGGVYVDSAHLAVTGCTVDDNAAVLGGGLWVNLANAMITNTSLSSNVGGGVHFSGESDPEITNCTVQDNAGETGGIYFEDMVDGVAIVSDVTIDGNTSTGTRGGGGIVCEGASPTIENCTIQNNQASSHGGGLACWSGSEPRLTGTDFIDNASPTRGGAAYASFSALSLSNCLIRGNTARTGGAVHGESQSTIDLTNCVVQHNAASTYGGGIWAGDGVNVSLSNTTMCCNATLDGQVNEGAAWTDLGGNDVAEQCDGDCNCNETTDSVDIFNGTSMDCNGGGVPDECEFDCDGDGVIDDCDDDLDLDGNGIPDNCDIDCNGNGFADAFDISSGADTDCDGDAVPDQCQLDAAEATDCDGNGLLDVCDISGDPSLDCNGNGLPDSCDIADGLESDCNQDGMPDDCQIADGSLEDCDGNDIPDACDVAGGGDPNGDGDLDICECDSDISSTGGLGTPDAEVDQFDLIAVLSAWGDSGEAGEDITLDGVVDLQDLFAVLVEWGTCPFN